MPQPMSATRQPVLQYNKYPYLYLVLDYSALYLD